MDRQIGRQIDEMVRRIVEGFHPERIILFGSHASGVADPDSDVDLLVVLRIDGSRRQVAFEIDGALSDRELPLDPIVVTPEDFERGQDQIDSIVRPAVLEGRVVYEPAG
jgi:predicted nucleotidyltransferase